jgi:hypothetical protein
MASLPYKKRPPGRLEVSGATALAACMSQEESILAEAQTLPKARSQHNCSGTRWKQSMTTDFYVVPDVVPLPLPPAVAGSLDKGSIIAAGGVRG